MLVDVVTDVVVLVTVLLLVEAPLWSVPRRWWCLSFGERFRWSRLSTERSRSPYSHPVSALVVVTVDVADVPGHGGAGRIDTDELDDGVYEECQNDGRQHAESDQYGGACDARSTLPPGCRRPVAHSPVAHSPVARPVAHSPVDRGRNRCRPDYWIRCSSRIGWDLGGIAVVGSSGDPLRHGARW